MVERSFKIDLAFWAQYRRVSNRRTDTQIDTVRQQRPRYRALQG